jgi:IS5 family transposase
MDATLITAPTSSKKIGKRDQEMCQTKKDKRLSFGMKVHACMDKNSGIIHSVVVKASKLHVLTTAAELLHGDEEVVYGDAGC